MAAEKRVVSKLLAPSKTSEKTYIIDDHVVTLVAGLSSDANILVQNARVAAQRYLYTYQEPMPIEQIVKHVCDYKQAYTQFGGLRPFGVAFLFAGYDTHYGFQLYQSDPSGNFSGWKATVIGTYDGYLFIHKNYLFLVRNIIILLLLLFLIYRPKQSSWKKFVEDRLQRRKHSGYQYQTSD